jgi:HlyD family secretion protein
LSVNKGNLRRELLFVVAMASVAWIGCSGSKPAPEPAVTVQAATVQKKTIQQIVSTEAVLYPKSEASIVPKISAPVQKFYVNRGSHVKAGQLIAQLENKDLQAAVDQAKGAYEQAQAAYDTSTQVNLPADIQNAELDVKATRQAMESARMEYESREKLYKSGAIARNLMEQAHVAYIQANNQYQMAEAHLEGLRKVGQSAGQKTAEGQLASAKGQYQAALAQYQYSQIRSPITGVVTDRPLFEGQMATAGTPLMTIMDLSHVVGRAFVSPEQASQLHVGDSATILPGNGADEVPAKVTVVSPALDANSTTVQVWVEAPNPHERLRPGSTVKVNMVAESVKDALVIPAAAIVTGDGGATTVMVIGTDQHAHQTGVKTGIREGSDVQITSGVRAGQQVVTEGAYGLPDGSKVQIASSAAPAAAAD